MALTLDGNTGVSLVQDGVVTAADLASTLDLTGKTVTLPAGVGGKVLQVLTVEKNNVFSTSATSFTNITDLSIVITPSSTSSRIFMFFNGSVGGDADRLVLIAPARNGTTLGLANIDGTRSVSFAGVHTIRNASADYAAVNNLAFQYVDSPNTTSSTTYTVQMKTGLSGYTMYLGRHGEMGSSSDKNRSTFSSTFTVMEIAA